jgi:Fur family transcriptional regulator, ferric uptake regulator
MNEHDQPRQRQTRQRQLILETLRGLKTHPTADEVYHLVRRQMPSVSLGTVYRNLERLSSDGLVRKIHGEGGSRRFDGDLSPHHHTRCRRCGRLEDLAAQLPLPELGGLPSLGGFQVQGYRLELVGLCLRCQAGDSEPVDSN